MQYSSWKPLRCTLYLRVHCCVFRTFSKLDKLSEKFADVYISYKEKPFVWESYDLTSKVIKDFIAFAPLHEVMLLVFALWP